MEKSLNCPCGEKIRSVKIDEVIALIKDEKFIKERCVKCKKDIIFELEVGFKPYPEV